MLELKRIGAWADEKGVHFRVWAPKPKTVELAWWRAGASEPEYFSMKPEHRGYYSLSLSEAKAGDLYKFRLDRKQSIPDPASCFQPDGPHEASQVLGREYKWSDQAFQTAPLNELVIYELHVGTFTAEGTFAAIEEKLNHLKELGVNCIEIMPIAQFSGQRNWGYDGVGLFAPQNSYGPPETLKHLVDACHNQNLSVILDVVYNHLGPEGNYLPLLGPYFQTKYKTPWGDALNYDEHGSDEVRNYFLQNARQWLEDYHIDGLRLDAVHAIFDVSAKPFLEELSELRDELSSKLGKPLYLIAESDSNDSRILRSREQGGLGLDAHWADDLHHVVHSLLTGEEQAYYSGYGKLEHLAKIYETGLLFDGDYSESRARRVGRSYSDIDNFRLLVCAQNHDQIGNRKSGDRLSTLVSPEKLRLAAALVLLSPGMPLLFMGEEWGETNPFLYFVDHQDKKLLEAVRKGRKEEFSGFNWEGEVPDPASNETFESSKINWDFDNDAKRSELFKYYQELIRLSIKLRREKLFKKGSIHTSLEKQKKNFKVSNQSQDLHLVFSFSEKPQKMELGKSGVDIVFDSLSNSRLTNGALEIQPYSALILQGALG